MSILDSLYSTPATQAVDQVAQMRNMYSAITSSADPTSYIQQIAVTNPAVNQAMSLIKQNGGDVRTVTLNYAKQNGFDVNSLLTALGQR